jgi:alpha-tubulin suppressor-like RCC1 family protein
MVALAGQVLTNVVAISAGRYHALALKGDGSVVAWGDNRFGQTSVPAGLTDVVAIAAGGEHSVALRRNGTVVVWGDNEYGELSVPPGLGTVVAISAGGQHSLALKRDGTVAMWGFSGTYRVLPVGLSNVVAVVAGTDISRRDLAIKSDGMVIEWSVQGSIEPIGRPPREDLASPSPLGMSADRLAISGLTEVSAAAVGGAQSFAVRRDGTVVQWEPGENVNAATRLSLTASPPAKNGLLAIGGQIVSNIVAVAAPASNGEFAFGRPVNQFGLAFKQDGTVLAWGNVDRFHPATVPTGLRHVVGIAAGPNFCLAITTDENPLK